MSLVAHTRRILSFGTDLEALLDTNGRVPYDGVWTTSLSRDGFCGVYPATQGCTQGSSLQGTAPHGLPLSMSLSVSCLAPTFDVLSTLSYGHANP